MALIERTVDIDGNVLREEVIEEKSPWMTIREAANYLRVTDHTIHDYCRQGKLTKKRILDFHSVRVPRAEVEAMVMPYDGEIEDQLIIEGLESA